MSRDEPERWIWITRWEAFQHYAPDPKRGPAWIKDYTAQMDDERYLRLSDRQRALLRDLRDVFATMRGRLSDDTAMITRRRNSQTRRADLEALNHAGLIEFLSRESLERALEELYASRAPAHSRELEKEKEKVFSEVRTARPNAAAYEPTRNGPEPDIDKVDPAAALELARQLAGHPHTPDG